MAEIIGTHDGRGNVPILAVVGAKHVMPNSKIHYSLGLNGISYVTIVQQPEVLQVLGENAHFFKTS